MNIVVNNLGRRFNQEWIFSGLSYSFLAGQKYALLGSNGSGKSTLLSILLSSLSPSEGDLVYQDGEKILSPSEVYQHIAFSAPYLDLIEEFTLQETIDFHFKFKNIHPKIDKKGILALLNLAKSEDKALKYFSSGMKQRTKLVLAFCSDTPILLLDEPTSNLDQQGIDWYNELVENFTENRLVVVASNQAHEYSFCENVIRIADYKTNY
ncbi:MAG: ATP-binding cassette domain-containing protein [Sphingobacteriaceae bacterium]|nr:ATP-binding cassette domain-containing protein [Sphingobacteriaceae bacterium]